MLVGATGTGKSTLVDGIVNYVLGANWEDPFRFTVIDLEQEEKDRIKNQVNSYKTILLFQVFNISTHDFYFHFVFILNVIFETLRMTKWVQCIYSN